MHVWDKGGFLAIHKVCFEKNLPLNVIKALIKGYPTSVKQKSQSSGLLPLHCAVHQYSSANSEIVRILLIHYQEGSAEKEENGLTPLIYHLLLNQSPSLHMKKMLINARQETIHLKDNREWTPLHCAAYRCIWEISQYLIEINPGSLIEKNIENDTPRLITISNGRYQMAEKFREFEGDIQTGMIKIPEHTNKYNININYSLKLKVNRLKN